MAVNLIIPPLGESISEATIAKWLKGVGQAVAQDEPLAELETDKVTVTLPAPTAGVLTEQKFQVGAVVRVGDSIGTVDPQGQAKAAEAPAKGEAPAKSEAPAKAEAPAPVKADKADKALEKTEEKQPAKAQAPAPAAESAPKAAPAAQAQATPAPAHGSSEPPRVGNSPSMRQWRREHGVDPAATLFSGQAAQPGQAAPAKAPAGTPAPAAAPAGGPEEVVTMTPLRRRIAERLVQAQHTAAILTTFNEVDMSHIMELRARHQDDFVKRHGIKLGFMSFFAAACARSLVDFPGVNAEVRGDAIVYKRYYDFGIAVGSGKGLVVPVLRGVDKMSFAEIEKGIAELAQKAKDNKLQLPDLAGGTFSITNGGIYGSMMSTPLLNMPQTGILGMHNIVRRPVAVQTPEGEKIEIRPMMYVALSYDHRVVDGREAVSFLVKVKERLENPEKLLLGL